METLTITKRPRVRSSLVQLIYSTRWTKVTKNIYRAPLAMIHEAIQEPKAWKVYNSTRWIRNLAGH